MVRATCIAGARVMPYFVKKIATLLGGHVGLAVQSNDEIILLHANFFRRTAVPNSGYRYARRQGSVSIPISTFASERT